MPSRIRAWFSLAGRDPAFSGVLVTLSHLAAESLKEMASGATLLEVLEGEGNVIAERLKALIENGAQGEGTVDSSAVDAAAGVQVWRLEMAPEIVSPTPFSSASHSRGVDYNSNKLLMIFDCQGAVKKGEDEFGKL